MRNYLWGSLLILFLLCSNAFADSSVQKIEVTPLTGGVSFNIVTFETVISRGWTTCPTVEMVGRKRVVIINNSVNDVYLSGLSDSTVSAIASGTLVAGRTASFAASSNLHIYASANTVSTIEVWEIR